MLRGFSHLPPESGLQSVHLLLRDEKGYAIKESIEVKLKWRCRHCDEKRGDVITSYEYQNGKQFRVSYWNNPCGHRDDRKTVFIEAYTNGMNQDLKYKIGQVIENY